MRHRGKADTATPPYDKKVNPKLSSGNRFADLYLYGACPAHMGILSGEAGGTGVPWPANWLL